MIVLLTGCITRRISIWKRFDPGRGFNEGDMIPDEFTCKSRDIHLRFPGKGYLMKQRVSHDNG